jgi:hypothetical protein
MTRVRVLSLVLALAAAAPARADLPSPITPALFGFPGHSLAPGSARAAALAGAGRWLGDEPFHNPALGAADGLVLTPVLQRVSRQDLRAENRNYDETSVFFDVLGGWVGRGAGAWTLAAYVHQPLVRHERFAYTRGVNAVQPALIQGQADQREYRAGLAVSRRAGSWRFGVAGEWHGRSDTYETVEQSGSPSSGMSHADFSGGAIGGQVGARWDGEAPWGGALAAGAGLRFVPALDLDGELRYELLTGDSTGTLAVTRESGWEGGVSAAADATPTFRVLVSAGGRTGQDWDAFGVRDGTLFEWKLGGEFHAPDVPWTFRFGLGQEQQQGVAESRSGVLGLGLGWDLGDMRADFGAVRRTLERDAQPTSYEDRLVGSVVVTF